MAVAGRAWLRARQHAAFADGARTITVLAPPQADPAGGETLWANLAGLMRPPLARWWHGQPHLGWEYTWTPDGMTISVWVPGAIPPGMVERAIEAAWPGAHTITASAAPLIPAGSLATGGTLRLARPEILPLKTDHGSDPLRALAAAGTGLAGGEQAIVQVLARPATGSRLRRARRAMRRLRYGQPGRLPSRLLDAISPGGHARGTRRAAARPDPELGGDLRAALAKAAGPQWDTQIRYAVATTTTAPGTGRARRAAAGTARPPESQAGASAQAACCRSPSWPASPTCPPTRRSRAWPAPEPAPSPRRRRSRSPAPRPGRWGPLTQGHRARWPSPCPTPATTPGSSARPAPGRPP